MRAEVDHHGMDTATRIRIEGRGMNVGEYKQAKTREIVEEAISQLCAVGLSADGAAGLLVRQGMIRIEDLRKRKEAAAFAAEHAEDAID